MRLKDQVAIITGGGTGIGKAIALAYAREGAHSVVVGRTPSTIEETAKEVKALGRKAIAIPTDVAFEEQVKAMVDKTLQEFGKVDILVNNAGIPGRVADVVDEDVEDWNRVLAVNLTGPMLCSREVLKYMIPLRRGVIINISSSAGKRGIAMRSPYCSTKWGLNGFNQSLAMEVGHRNIRVNAICPGNVTGERIERMIARTCQATGLPREQVMKQMVAGSPMGRMVTPEEVAALAVFLASDESSGMTGLLIDVSAGREVR
ncbi:MAG: SDR family oxidoreductase [Chloroflexi bacterium]|nr:SDR family oxidoreductase [Chloroflexota bacterium]